MSQIKRTFNTIAGKLPTWAWILVWLVVAILFGMQGDTLFGDSLYDASITTLGYVMMALGLNIVVGFAGLLDLGYVAFYAIGAFMGGWLMSSHFSDRDVHFIVSDVADKLPGLHVNFFLVIFLAAAVTAFWGAVLGAPTLRLRGDYLAIVTLAFGEIVPRVFELSESGLFGIGNTNWSNGRQGITPLDKPFAPIPGLDEITRLNITPFFFIALFMTCLVLFVNFRLRDSRLGRAWIAVREDEVAAAAMGVNLVRVKLWAYAIGAAIGGFSGAFLAVYRNTVNVDQFEFGFSVFILAMIIIGGMGNIGGVVVGAITLSMFERFALPELNPLTQSIIDFDITAISFGIFGFFLLAMMILRPEGFIPNRRRKMELHEGEGLGEEVAGDETLYAVRG
jgi:branched-chain amino acid transport system permease protein